jgi:hypothetical protein
LQRREELNDCLRIRLAINFRRENNVFHDYFRPAPWLEKESKKRGTSMAAIVRESLHKHLRGTEKISCYDLTRDACGSLRSGVKDLATNKKLLKGFGEWKRIQRVCRKKRR